MAATSLRSIIQREIIAVKHALANNMAHEGVEGDDLYDLLKDLQAHRAEVIAKAKTKPTEEQEPPLVHPARCRHSLEETENVLGESNSKRTKFARVEAPQQEDSLPLKTEADEEASAETDCAVELCDEVSTPKEELQMVENKRRKSSKIEDLRQIRRDIKVGDVLSVVRQMMIIWFVVTLDPSHLAAIVRSLERLKKEDHATARTAWMGTDVSQI